MNHTIQVTGHRGAAGLAPENTLAGFRLARSLGCDAVEFDVHLTADQVLAVIHDSTLDRTTNGSGPVSARTMDELSRLDAGSGEPVPSLAQVVDLLGSSGMILQIELKGNGTAAPTAEFIRDAGMSDRVRFTSFHHSRVLEAAGILPDAQAGILVSCSPVDPGSMLNAAGAGYFHINASRIDEELVAAVRKAGKKVAVWGTVEDPDLIDFLIDLEVDAIGSNLPDMIIGRLIDRGLRPAGS